MINTQFDIQDLDHISHIIEIESDSENELQIPITAQTKTPPLMSLSVPALLLLPTPNPTKNSHQLLSMPNLTKITSLLELSSSDLSDLSSSMFKTPTA